MEGKETGHLKNIYYAVFFAAAAIVLTLAAGAYFNNGAVLWRNSIVFVEIAAIVGLLATAGFVIAILVGAFNPANTSKGSKVAAVAGTICILALFAVIFASDFLPDLDVSITAHINSIVAAQYMWFCILFGIGWSLVLTWVLRFAASKLGKKKK